MKKFVFGIICLALAVGAFAYMDSREKQIDDREYQRAERFYKQQLADNFVRNAINEAKSLDDLYKIKELPKDLMNYYSLKEAAFLFKQAEIVIEKAAQVENALHVPAEEPSNPEDPNQQPQQELNPKTIKLLKESEVYYDKARKIVDNLPETLDKDFNFRVNYLKGLIYHRYLLFFSNQENVVELFNQAVTHYRTALKNKPSDVDTVINIELLIKDGKNLIGANPQSQRNKMLNIRKAGLGTRIGN